MLQSSPLKFKEEEGVSVMARFGVQIALLLLLSTWGACDGGVVCPHCGKLAVPYPLSTASSCGHPLYSMMCTAERKLQIRALSGNYTVESLDPQSRTMIISTGPFLNNSCITQDSVYAGNFSLFPNLPFFITPNNTVMLLNASSLLKYSPLKCGDQSPCSKALSVIPQASCRSSLCCSFLTGDTNFFRYGFPVLGQETGYVAVVDDLSDPSIDPSLWRFGLKLGWEIPREPPCLHQAECGRNSSCLPTPAVSTLPGMPIPAPTMAAGVLFCLCNHGYLWDPIIGSCLKAPYCVQNSGSVRCHKMQYTIGLTIGIFGLIVLCVLTIFMCKKWQATQKARDKLVKERSLILAANSGGKSARLFSDAEMKRATNGFARDGVLGCGGFGEVFKGILDDKTVVAIKSAKIGNVKGIDQVLNEVRILSQVNHRNLVRLIGCCVESVLPLMVYEYVPNGNLYDHLLMKDILLTWKTRLQIGFQSAEGLAYLHSAAYPPIYHRDVKSSNILLDKDMNARVADFGISRLAEPDLTHVSTCAQGTLGYLDPEYYRNYQLTDKSDVYSFGVVLLELVTSQKAIDFRRSQDDVNLVVMVQMRKEQGKVDEVLDPELAKSEATEVVNSMRWVIELALECLSENRLKRPSMKEVAEKLQQIISSLEAAERVADNNGGKGYKHVDF